MITNKLQLYQAAQICKIKHINCVYNTTKLMYKSIIQLTNDNN